MTPSPYARHPRDETMTPALEAKRLGPVRRGLRGLLLWLAGLIQGSPVWPYPLQALYSLEDRPGRCYIWVLKPDATDEEATDIADAFNSAFLRKFNRETRALHVVTPDVESIRRLTRQDAERYVVPWLRHEEDQA